MQNKNFKIGDFIKNTNFHYPYAKIISRDPLGYSIQWLDAFGNGASYGYIDHLVINHSYEIIPFSEVLKDITVFIDKQIEELTKRKLNLVLHLT